MKGHEGGNTGKTSWIPLCGKHAVSEDGWARDLPLPALGREDRHVQRCICSGDDVMAPR